MRWFTRLHRLWFALLLALSSALGMSVWLAGVASAHASYVSSDPAAGAVLATAPTQVTVRFAENVNPAGASGVPSSLTVYHETGAKNTWSFDEEAKQVSPDKGTQFPLSDAKSMIIPIQGDGNGIYVVSWHTVSADDGDPDSGVFFFGVGAGNVLGSTAPATTSTNGSSGLPIWVTILVGIVGLGLGAAVVAGMRRRPQAPAGSAGGGTTVTPPPEGTPAEKR